MVGLVLFSFGNKTGKIMSLCGCGVILGKIEIDEWFIVFCQSDGTTGIVSHVEKCPRCDREYVAVNSYPTQREVEAAVHYWLNRLSIEDAEAKKAGRTPSLPFPLEYRLPIDLMEHLANKIREIERGDN